jgi:hypothetical protein
VNIFDELIKYELFSAYGKKKEEKINKKKIENKTNMLRSRVLEEKVHKI